MIFLDPTQPWAISLEITGRNQVSEIVPIANGPSGVGSENIGSTDPSTTAEIRSSIAAQFRSAGDLSEWAEPIARYPARYAAKIAPTRHAGYICQRYPSVHKSIMPSATARTTSAFIHVVQVSFLANETTMTMPSIATRMISRILMKIDVKP
jgi:hypothetical protein